MKAQRQIAWKRVNNIFNKCQTGVQDDFEIHPALNNINFYILWFSLDQTKTQGSYSLGNGCNFICDSALRQSGKSGLYLRVRDIGDLSRSQSMFSKAAPFPHPWWN